MNISYLQPPDGGVMTQWGGWEQRQIAVGVIGTGSVVLLEPLIWRDPDGRAIAVPEGFLCDGASLPKGVWWLMGGRLSLSYLRSAIVHDYSIMMGDKDHLATSTRFYGGLRADGMSYPKARLCYYGVYWWAKATRN